jgi:carboxypeptidase Taq
MTPTDAYAELIRRRKEGATLESCGAILGWDEQTYMPHGGSAFRGDQMALLAKLGHEMNTHPKVGELLEILEASDLPGNPQSPETINVREIRRAYNRAVKLPQALVEELARVTTQAQQAWRDARTADDFAAFQPWLEKVVRLKKDEADAVGYEAHPYDALLDEYEPGARAAEIEATFAALSKDLVPMIAEIRESTRKADRSIVERDFPVDAQKHFATRAAKAIGFDFNAGRLDVTAHPFCSGIGPGDCRITTRYNPKFFNEAFFGVLHEAGHALYEQGLPPEHFGTPLGSYCSLGIHESQSRLWENQVGRGRAFWTHFYPFAQYAFDGLADIAPDDFYFAINEVRPSFIRVEADEATYNLHIILRFEIEKALLTGELPVADLPGAWNERFEKMFGLTVPDNRQGCLQDIHWSMGGLGYFPTYTLGNLYSAQFMTAARKEIGDLDARFAVGDFAPLKRWLNANIHRAGRSMRANDLCRHVTGDGLSHRPLIAYLREKFGALYGIG